MIRAAAFAILSLCAVVSVGASTSPATPSVACDKPKATVCRIRKLPEPPNGVVLPDLSKRTELWVRDGSLRNLTRAMIAPTGTKLRLVHMEQLGLEAIFVLSNFEELRLAHNRLSTVTLPPDVTSPALKVLDVRDNRLANATQLAPFVRLEELYLDGNLLSDLSLGLFERMVDLRVLSLASNRLTTLPAGGEFALPSLESLSLADNQLTELRTARWQLPSLRVLLLNDNRLVELPELAGSFDQFPALERAALGGNRWSCAWLAHTLRNATFEIVREPASDTQANCTFENVAGVCCQFTVADGGGGMEAATPPPGLFWPEIEQAREMTVRIDARHREFVRNGTERVGQFAALVHKKLTELNELVQSEEPPYATREQVQSLRQSVAELSARVAQLQQSARVIANAELEQKRLLHFMLDMKNKLVRQAIETDDILDQVDRQWAAFDRQLEERLAQKTQKKGKEPTVD